jgi:protein phosphatase
MSLPRLTVHTKTDIGNKRVRNEDSFLSDPGKGLFAVADGMGGGPSGNVASQQTVGFLAKMTDNVEPRDLDVAVRETADFVYGLTTKNRNLEGMGSTLTAIWFDGDVAYVANIGDSRIYLHRDGAVTQITDDHTLFNDYRKVNQVVDIRWRNILTRCVGQSVGVAPDVSIIQVQEGDRFLLCSDGFYQYADLDQVGAFMSNGSSVDDYIQHALDHGGDDNITVIRVNVDSLD